MKTYKVVRDDGLTTAKEPQNSWGDDSVRLLFRDPEGDYYDYARTEEQFELCLFIEAKCNGQKLNDGDRFSTPWGFFEVVSCFEVRKVEV